MPSYTPEFRRRVVSEVRSGSHIKEVAKRFAVSESSVRRWLSHRHRSAQSHEADCMCSRCARYRHT